MVPLVHGAIYGGKHIGLVISPLISVSKPTNKILRRFFANFCHEIGCENDQTYIFRFVRYLSTFFHTYLPINIHFTDSKSCQIIKSILKYKNGFKNNLMYKEIFN
jgi:hypothetical protein